MRQETLCQTATRIHVDFGDSSVFLLQVWPWRLGCRWKCPAYRQLWLLLFVWLLWNLSPPFIFSDSQEYVKSDDLSDPKWPSLLKDFVVSLPWTILSTLFQLCPGTFLPELPPDTADCPVACEASMKPQKVRWWRHAAPSSFFDVGNKMRDLVVEIWDNFC